jgi:hypothetical protein
MIVELDTYRINFEYVKNALETKKHPDLGRQLSELSLTTSCPIIVIYYFAGEILGFNDEINKSIESLKKFYRIEEVR